MYCRRRFIEFAGVFAITATLPERSFALDYPTRPVRWIVASPAGSQPDIIARLIGQAVSDRLHQPVIIANRPGAGSNISTEIVATAPADGYTLLHVSAAAAINATLYDNLKFNFIRDIAPVASINNIPLVLVVEPSFPAKSISELLDYAKTSPDKFNLASAPKGSGPYMAAALFGMLTGIKMTQIAYQGDAEALASLFGGQVQASFDGISSCIAQINAGKLRALGVATKERLGTLPDVPTIGETVQGFEASGWFGVGAPMGTPPEIINKLNQEFNAVIADPVMKERLVDLGVEPMEMTPAGFGTLIASETEKWGKVVRSIGMTPD